MAATGSMAGVRTVLVIVVHFVSGPIIRGPVIEPVSQAWLAAVRVT